MSEIICIVLVAFGGFLIGVIVGSDPAIKNMNELKAQCELELPRNQQCVMYFKPEGE